MVNPQVVERRKTMLDSKWEKRARTELEAREREADLAAAAARAALMAEAQALTEAKRRGNHRDDRVAEEGDRGISWRPQRGGCILATGMPRRKRRALTT